ncbi:KGK domain-containing protein [Pseudanabaena sp. UWO310]|uniref:KGK domain-containing protein n=1 Tax=Pseudanabaena sp. UWO310 TaxID=2480795 RepID=UPI001158D246|nr:KGK domain-containing protein [Pseudanabaena sp. UWO310]TYQ27958.1 hypothetical protein PseudUWO310_14825 [Pseudanabaena sp. UWO310]
MSERIEALNPDDVVCLTEDDEYGSPVYQIEQRFNIARLFEFGDFVDGISRVLGISSDAIELLKKGIPCRVMTTRKTGWRLGKIRLKIELQFIPDESFAEGIVRNFDSPLDEIRKTVES